MKKFSQIIKENNETESNVDFLSKIAWESEIAVYLYNSGLVDENLNSLLHTFEGDISWEDTDIIHDICQDNNNFDMSYDISDTDLRGVIERMKNLAETYGGLFDIYMKMNTP